MIMYLESCVSVMIVSLCNCDDVFRQKPIMSVDTVPKSLKQLRACLVCSLIKTFDQFESDGCDNCELRQIRSPSFSSLNLGETVLHLKRNRDNVYDCTSSNFEVRQHL